MALALVYDPRYHTWESWSSLMVEAYAGQQLAIGIQEKNWRDWASGINAIDIFMNEAIPSPNYYENWRDWATALVNAVNQKVE
jgi:hypothetical protein